MLNWDIVALAPCSWSGNWQRPQHILSRISNNQCNVLYIEPTPPLLSRSLWIGLTSSSLQRPHVVFRQTMIRATPDLALMIVPPVCLLGARYSRRITRWNGRQIAIRLSDALAWAGISRSRFFFWATLPEHLEIVQHFPDVPVVYDCMDDQSGWNRFLDKDRLIAQLEQELVHRARVVFASSEPLVRKIASYGSHAHIVRNAVEARRFARGAEERLVPPELSNVESPIALYIGNVAPWVDTETLYELALTGDVAVVLVGEVSTDIGKLEALANVHILGPRPYRTIPSYIEASDVCLYPFRTSSLTESVNPVKVWEYLAGGKPVVSYDFAEIRQMGEVVRIAGSREAFIKAVQETLRDMPIPNHTGNADKQKHLVEANTWDARVDTIKKVLKSELL